MRTPLQCAYCSKPGFASEKLLDRHVNQECAVSRSFRAKPVADGSTSEVKMLIQGKMKRRADVKTVSENAASSLFDMSMLHTNRPSNQHDTTTISDPLRRGFPGKSSTTATIQPRTKAAVAKHPSRPTHLDSLLVKPPPPQQQDDLPASLFVGNTTSGYTANRASATRPRLPRKTDKLQTLPRQRGAN